MCSVVWRAGSAHSSSPNHVCVHRLFALSQALVISQVVLTAAAAGSATPSDAQPATAPLADAKPASGGAPADAPADAKPASGGAPADAKPASGGAPAEGSAA